MNSGEDNDFILLSEVDNHIKENNLNLAYGILKDILEKKPQFGPALNHMGWIYAHYFVDFLKAEDCYRLAIKYNPDYPHTYLNYSWLLISEQRFSDLNKLLEDAIKVKGINKSKVYMEFGVMYEEQEEFIKACDAYKKAIKHCLITNNVEVLRNSIYRCQMKWEMMIY